MDRPVRTRRRAPPWGCLILAAWASRISSRPSPARTLEADQRGQPGLDHDCPITWRTQWSSAAARGTSRLRTLRKPRKRLCCSHSVVDAGTWGRDKPVCRSDGPFGPYATGTHCRRGDPARSGLGVLSVPFARAQNQACTPVMARVVSLQGSVELRSAAKGDVGARQAPRHPAVPGRSPAHRPQQPRRAVHPLREPAAGGPEHHGLGTRGAGRDDRGVLHRRDLPQRTPVAPATPSPASRASSRSIPRSATPRSRAPSSWWR